MDIPEFKYHLYMIRRQLIILAILLAIIAGVYFFSPKTDIGGPGSGSMSLAEQIRTGEAAVPAYASSTQEKLERSHGFQMVVSYTDSGFEPAQISITKGDTIRFTNNSSGKLWVAASGNTLYPSAGKECGSSALDSCAPFDPMDFWEFTFDAAGEWELVNNLDKTKNAVVRVEVK